MVDKKLTLRSNKYPESLPMLAPSPRKLPNMTHLVCDFIDRSRQANNFLDNFMTPLLVQNVLTYPGAR